MNDFKELLFGILSIEIAVLIFSAGIWVSQKNEKVIQDSVIDTVIVTNTIVDTILLVKNTEIIRTDTIFVMQPIDTVKIHILLPIERKTYNTK